MLIVLSGCSNSDSSSQVKEESYTIKKVANEVDWSQIPTLAIDKVLWCEDTGIRGTGQLCYSDEYLYVHMSAVEKDIRAENTQPLSPVYEDSCLEFFFEPEGANKYFNFEINPNGCMNIQIGPTKPDRVSLVRSDAKEYFNIQTERTNNGWEVFYRIPLSFIQLVFPDFQFKGNIKGNMDKCGNLTVYKHYVSWTKIDLDQPNFHCPEYFGLMHFE